MICTRCENENPEETIFCHFCLSLSEDSLPAGYRGKNFDRLRQACFGFFNDEISAEELRSVLDTLRETVIENLEVVQTMECDSQVIEEISAQRDLALQGMTLFLEALESLYAYPEEREFSILEESLSRAEQGNAMLNEAIGIIREQEGICGEGVLNLRI